jgi:hypothetical protein
MLMLGMCLPSWTSAKNQERVEEVRRLRYKMQDNNLAEFLDDEKRT